MRSTPPSLLSMRRCRDLHPDSVDGLPTAAHGLLLRPARAAALAVVDQEVAACPSERSQGLVASSWRCRFSTPGRRSATGTGSPSDDLLVIGCALGVCSISSHGSGCWRSPRAEMVGTRSVALVHDAIERLGGSFKTHPFAALTFSHGSGRAAGRHSVT